jgi:type II secretory pathway pseudopilin PulG
MRTHRCGFSTVELLVVIAILGFLIGLLLAAIQKAREAARRIESANNLRNIGFAMHNLEAASGEFPAGRDAKGFSAFAHILGALELNAVERKVNLDKPMTDTANADARKMQVKVFLSPRDPLKPTGEYGGTNYFLCAGPKPGLKDNTGVFREGKSYTITEISNNNGTSNTVMMGESLRGDGGTKAVTVNRQNVALKKDALKDLKDESGVSDFKDGTHIAGNRGGSWMDGNFLQATFTGTRVPNDPRPDVDCEGAGGLMALRSLDGLTPLLFVDNHVQTIRNKVDIKVWKAITDVKNQQAVKIPE